MPSRRMLPAQVSTGNQVAGEGGSLMRLRMLAWGAVLGLLVALFTPMAALAQADTTTIHFSDTESFDDVNPCTGVPGTFSGTFKGVIHTTALPDGSSHFTITVTETFTFVPDDPSQPTYTGKSTFWAGDNLNPQNNFNTTFTSIFVVKGTDGSKISGTEVGHVTQQPDGTVTVEFDRPRLRCP
jgi:hypothetical protein